MYSCSIIIIAYNSCDFIPACLKSVRDACDGIDAQIIVLDNGSMTIDGQNAWLMEKFEEACRKG